MKVISYFSFSLGVVSGKALPTCPFRKGLAPAFSSWLDPVAKGLRTQEHAFSGQPASNEGGRAWTGAISAQRGTCVLQTSLWMDRCFTDLPHSSNVFLPYFASALYLPQVFVSKKQKQKQKQRKKNACTLKSCLIICFQRSQPTTVHPGVVLQSTSITRDLGGQIPSHMTGNENPADDRGNMGALWPKGTVLRNM